MRGWGRQRGSTPFCKTLQNLDMEMEKYMKREGSKVSTLKCRCIPMTHRYLDAGKGKCRCIPMTHRYLDAGKGKCKRMEKRFMKGEENKYILVLTNCWYKL